MVGFTENISVIIVAALLSLLPVVLLFWAYYLRERTPTVPGRVITRFFAAGMFTVLPALVLETGAHTVVGEVSPVLASAFFAEFFALNVARDLFLAFLVSFMVIALVEEGLRYLFLRLLFARSEEINQTVDGLQVGVASGIGFAFVENTLYFLRLLERLDFDTLAVVFFLRFLISTFGHIAFGGVMGLELTHALARPLERRSRLVRAFVLPWAMHGLFDFLLSVRLSAYTVLLLLIPLIGLWQLAHAPQLHEQFRIRGRFLKFPVRTSRRSFGLWRRPPLDLLPMVPWCPNCLDRRVPERAACVSCGTPFTRAEMAPASPAALAGRSSWRPP